jgi:hypothetical protein
MKRAWPTVIFVLFVLLELIWSGYSALAWLGAAFPDYADDKIFNHIKSLEISVVWWRWLAVSLMLGIVWRSLQRGMNVQENSDR